MGLFRRYIFPISVIFIVVLFFRFYLLDTERFSRTWDENGYLASAMHIRKDKGLETNFEVPPLAKIFMALTLPNLTHDYYVPRHSPLRMGHETLGLAFWEKIPQSDQLLILSRARSAQALLAGMSLLLISVFLLSSLKEFKAATLLLLVSAGTTLLWAQAMMATTEGLLVFILCCIVLLAYFSLGLKRSVKWADFFLGLLCGLGVCTKGTFLGLSPLIALGWIFCRVADRKNFLKVTFFCFAGFWLSLWIVFGFDNYLRMAAELGTPSYHAFSKIMVGNSFLQQGFLKIIEIGLLPQQLGPIVFFNLKLASSGPYTAEMLGRVVDQNVWTACLFWIQKSGPVEIVLIFSAIFHLFLVRRTVRERDYFSLFLCLVTLSFIGLFFLSGVKLASRYLIPLLVFGIFALPRTYECFNNRKLKFYLFTVLLFQGLIIFRFKDNFLSQRNFFTLFAGGDVGNVSLLEDLGQESLKVQNELKDLRGSPTLFFSYNFPDRSLTPKPQEFRTHCHEENALFLGTSSNNLTEQFKFFLEAFEIDLAKPFKKVGEGGFIFKIPCKDSPLNTILGRDSLVSSSPVDAKLLVLLCTKIDFPDFLVVDIEGQETLGAHLLKLSYFTSQKENQETIHFVRLPRNMKGLKGTLKSCDNRFFKKI
jgi:hypothetical protein